jgi:hypothetical protein
MDEIQPEKWMILVFDSAVHVNATPGAGVALNGRGCIHDRQPIFVGGDANLVTRHHRDLREHRALGFPALGTATDVIMCTLRADRYLDGILIALAHQRRAGAILRPGFHTLIHGRVN